MLRSVGAPLPRPGTLPLMMLGVQSGVPPTLHYKGFLALCRASSLDVRALLVLAYKPLIIGDNNSECHYSTLQYDKKWSFIVMFRYAFFFFFLLPLNRSMRPIWHHCTIWRGQISNYFNHRPSKKFFSFSALENFLFPFCFLVVFCFEIEQLWNFMDSPHLTLISAHLAVQWVNNTLQGFFDTLSTKQRQLKWITWTFKVEPKNFQRFLDKIGIMAWGPGPFVKSNIVTSGWTKCWCWKAILKIKHLLNDTHQFVSHFYIFIIRWCCD